MQIKESKMLTIKNSLQFGFSVRDGVVFVDEKATGNVEISRIESGVFIVYFRDEHQRPDTTEWCKFSALVRPGGGLSFNLMRNFAVLFLCNTTDSAVLKAAKGLPLADEGNATHVAQWLHDAMQKMMTLGADFVDPEYIGIYYGPEPVLAS